MLFQYKAYLVFTRDRNTQEIIRVGVWSSPPWEASQVERGTVNGVYLMDTGDSFHNARINLLRRLASAFAFTGGFKEYMNFFDHATKVELNSYIEELRQIRG